MINEEGGIDPEQFRMEAMFDRMDAIGKGILGLTIQCAQCHSHKYDPLTQEEYYRMFAFLNNSHEANVAVYTPDEQMKRAEIFRKIREIEAGLQHEHPDWPERMAAWEDSVTNDQPAVDRSCGPRSTPTTTAARSITCWRTARSWPRATRRPSTPPSSRRSKPVEDRSRRSGSNCSTTRTCRSAGRAGRSTGPVP